jgi:UDP-glucose 4-epimerase
MLYANVNKIVFSSSAAIYGEPENTPILEDDKKRPTNTYGQTKLDMENMIVGQVRHSESTLSPCVILTQLVRRRKQI